MKSKNKAVLNDFVKYCSKYPDLRFWQALRNWSNHNFIYVVDDPSGEGDTVDTFYWTKKNG